MNDLFQATGYAAIVYVIFNSVVTFGSGQPLVEWINPGRRYLPALAGVFMMGSYGSFKLASRKYHSSYFELWHSLLSEDRAPPEVIGSVTLAIIAASSILLAVWCHWSLPRAPSTFRLDPNDLVSEYRRALRHYVKWSGGVDYAILAEVRAGVFAELAAGSDDKAILHNLKRLPGLHGAAGGPDPLGELQKQKAVWNEFARRLISEWPKLNELVAPARHGSNGAVTFDLRYGSAFIEMVEVGEANGPEGGVATVLFAATLNQHESATLAAAKHFAMLSQAIRHIRTGVVRG